jgi:hypothetical protein
MKNTLRTALLTLPLLGAAAGALGASTFALTQFAYPGSGEYQVDTIINMPGQKPQTLSQVSCINPANQADAVQGISFGESMGQSMGCNAKVLEDTPRLAKIETVCSVGSTLATMERVSDDVVKMTSKSNSGAAAVVTSVSTMRWLRRSCVAKPVAPQQAPDMSKMVPKASDAQCAGMRDILNKMKSSPNKIPPESLQAMEGSMKMQGCSL